MDNIDRIYKALGMYDDPLVETLLIHNSDVVTPFHPTIPISEEVIALNRTDVLMNAHRFAADARRTFCDGCNANLANWIGTAAGFKDGADIIVTGDSPSEQITYARWINRLGNEFEAPVHTASSLEPKDPPLKRLFAKFDNVMQRRHQIMGHTPEEIAKRRIAHDMKKTSRFFSIFSDVSYTAKDHLPFLKNVLAFDFDNLAFSFTETDCANPTLMAHLHGLAAEKLFQCSYEEGVREYAKFATGLMQMKDFPEELIDVMRERYKDTAAISGMRKRAEEYAQEAYRLTPEQLTAMVYAPFAGQGANLHIFLERERHALLPQEGRIRNVLAGTEDDASLLQSLERISGLTLEQLRINYNSELVRNPLDASHKVDGLAAKLAEWGKEDPHQADLVTRINVLGTDKVIKITGR